MNYSSLSKLLRILWVFSLPFLFLFIGGAKKIETIPASLYISVEYGEEKNRESYRRDILSQIENYLENRGCFAKVTTDPEEKADLILSFIIDKLEFCCHYGASLGTMVSDQADPTVRLKQVTYLELRLLMQLKQSGSKNILIQKDIHIKESRQKMTMNEDTQDYVWASILNSIQDEVEKKICRKYKKIRNMLSQHERSN